MALPMPRTSKRAELRAGIELWWVIGAAHYSGRLLHGKLTDGMGTPYSRITTVTPARPQIWIRLGKVFADEV